MWLVLAEALVLLHLAYLAYVPLGGLLVQRDRRWIWPHLAVLAWGVIGVVAVRTCPLTLLEKEVRSAGGQTPYDGTFIGHYLEGTVWPESATGLVWLLTALVVVVTYRPLLAQRARTDDLLPH